MKLSYYNAGRSKTFECDVCSRSGLTVGNHPIDEIRALFREDSEIDREAWFFLEDAGICSDYIEVKE